MLGSLAPAGQPALRAATSLILLVSLVVAGLDLVAVVILRDQRVPPALIGLALGGGAAGGLAGARLVPLLHRVRPGVLLLAVCAFGASVLALLAVRAGPWWAAGVLFTAMLGVPAVRVLLDVLVFRPAPPQQRGRVIAATLTLLGLATSAGPAVAGLLLEYLPAPAVALALAGTLTAGTLWGAARRDLWRARWPGTAPPQ